MLDVQNIRNQTFMDSDTVTLEDAAELARSERWTPHVEDGLDAFARVIHEAEAEKWAKVIVEAGGNLAFRERLAADPAEAVRDFGIIVPSGLELRLVENTGTVRYLVLPSPAAGGLPAAEATTLADNLAFATAATRLPQCWADTWKANVPLDPGMPLPKPVQTPTR